MQRLSQMPFRVWERSNQAHLRRFRRRRLVTTDPADEFRCVVTNVLNQSLYPAA